MGLLTSSYQVTPACSRSSPRLGARSDRHVAHKGGTRPHSSLQSHTRSAAPRPFSLLTPAAPPAYELSAHRRLPLARSAQPPADTPDAKALYPTTPPLNGSGRVV